MYWDTFVKLGNKTEDLRKINTPLIGFSGAAVNPLGVITLPVRMGSRPCAIAANVDFLVVKLQSIYSIILGRTALNLFGAVVSTSHLTIKFPTPKGIGVEKGDQVEARSCYIAALKQRVDHISHVEGSNPARDHEEPVEDIHIPEDSGSIIDTKPDEKAPTEEPEVEEIEVATGRTLRVGKALEGAMREELISFLKKNVKVFAWTAEEMPGINRKISEHKLLIKPGAKAIRQKKRKMGIERHRAVR
jgi:hypothetical protein